jgi:hypothetical protein
MGFKLNDLTYISYTPEKSNFIKNILYSYSETDGKKYSEYLTVEFTDGRELEYRPAYEVINGDLEVISFKDIFDRWCKHPSAGKFWHNEIKGKFQYKKNKIKMPLDVICYQHRLRRLDCLRDNHEYVYICGKITGENREECWLRFEAIEENLWRQGLVPIKPIKDS